MVIAALMLIRVTNVPETIALIGIILMGGLIYFMAPSGHKNKPLSENEKKVYKEKVGKRVIVFIMLSFVAAIITSMGEILITIGIALMFLSVMMICNRQKV